MRWHKARTYCEKQKTKQNKNPQILHIFAFFSLTKGMYYKETLQLLDTTLFKLCRPVLSITVATNHMWLLSPENVASLN